MQETLSAIVTTIEEEERRIMRPVIRFSERPRDFLPSVFLLAFMGLFWVLVFSLRFFIQSHHLR
ncbi:MAG TPA: hypothetical protein VFO29_06230 [Candidatus Rubrimentiphilum sp.]|nr:hypothetical protein [Candidatus Rubrimentiphilum sp.]